MGNDTRRPLNNSENTPGPGSYKLPNKMIEGPRYSMKGATQVDPITREQIMLPGPGQY